MNDFDFAPLYPSASALSGIGAKAPGYSTTNSIIEDYIRKGARKRKMSERSALDVYEGEGKTNWQSTFRKDGEREPSFGPYQLFKQGLGKVFDKETGRNSANPDTWKTNVDFALDEAAEKKSWGPWYGNPNEDDSGLANASPIGKSMWSPFMPSSSDVSLPESGLNLAGAPSAQPGTTDMAGGGAGLLQSLLGGGGGGVEAVTGDLGMGGGGMSGVDIIRELLGGGAANAAGAGPQSVVPKTSPSVVPPSVAPFSPETLTGQLAPPIPVQTTPVTRDSAAGTLPPELGMPPDPSVYTPGQSDPSSMISLFKDRLASLEKPEETKKEIIGRMLMNFGAGMGTAASDVRGKKIGPGFLGSLSGGATTVGLGEQKYQSEQDALDAARGKETFGTMKDIMGFTLSQEKEAELRKYRSAKLASDAKHKGSDIKWASILQKVFEDQEENGGSFTDSFRRWAEKNPDLAGNMDLSMFAPGS